MDLFKPLMDGINHSKNPRVIAGGSVSNLLYNQKYNTQAPINDIDVFEFVQRSVPVIDTNKDGVVDDYVGEIIGKKNNLKILSSKRDKLFNYITVEVDYLYSTKELCLQLLERFDINQTQVGITLDEVPELVKTPEFDKFLQTRQICAVNIKTPVKTMLRLLKKKKELQCFLNENHLESIYQFARFNNQKITSYNVDKFKEEILYLKDYFRVYKMTGNIHKVFLKKEPLKLHRNEKIIIKNSNAKSLLRIFDACFNKEKIYSKYLKVRPYRRVLNCYIESESFFNQIKDDFSLSKVVELEKNLRRIPVLSKYFSKMSVLLASNQAHLVLSKIEHKDLYLRFCGELSLATEESQVCKTVEELQLKLKSFKSLIINHSELLKVPLVIDPILSKNVRELLTVFELVDEGLRNNHCVGGYGKKIVDDLCRIFSISSSGGNSTLEIAKVLKGSETHWIGIQHRANSNSVPCQKNRDIASGLLDYLNRDVLSSNKLHHYLESEFF